MNYDLYSMAMSTLELPYPAHRWCHTTAEGYLYRMLDTDYDIAINIDEDAFVIDNQRLVALLEYCIENEYVNCGFPDGGVLPVRKHNPLVTNPFFNILDLRKIRSRFDFAKVREHRVHQTEFESKAPWHLIKDEYVFDNFEPYVPFFVWMSQEFKVLYLDGRTHADGKSTVLMDHHGEPLIAHSWWSRQYREDEDHRRRIDSLYLSVEPKEPYRRSGVKRLAVMAADAVHGFCVNRLGLGSAPRHRPSKRFRG
jgi:hypothetical protein